MNSKPHIHTALSCRWAKKNKKTLEVLKYICFFRTFILQLNAFHYSLFSFSLLSLHSGVMWIVSGLAWLVLTKLAHRLFFLLLSSPTYTLSPTRSVFFRHSSTILELGNWVRLECFSSLLSSSLSSTLLKG